MGRTTAPQAAVRFEQEGPRRVRRGSGSCTVAWPRIGLTVVFGTLGLDPPDPCNGGTAFTATVNNRVAWRTVLGLRVGDTTARLRAIYARDLRVGSLGGATTGWSHADTAAKSADPPTTARLPESEAPASPARRLRRHLRVGTCFSCASRPSHRSASSAAWQPAPAKAPVINGARCGVRSRTGSGSRLALPCFSRGEGDRR